MIQSTGHTDMGGIADNYSVITDYQLGGGWQNLGLHSTSTQQYSATTVLAKRQNLTTFGKYVIGHSAAPLYNPPAVTEELRVKGCFYKVPLSNATVMNGITTDVNNESGGTITVLGSLFMDGAWNNTATANISTAVFQFQGAAVQTFGEASAITLKELIINKSLNDLTLTGDIIVTNQLTLSGGNLITSSANLLTLNDNTTSSSGSATSFVKGPVKKIGDDAFVFPTGKGTKWARIGISAPTSVNTEFTAEYFNSSYTNTSSVSAPLTDVSTFEYWTLNQSGTASDAAVTLYWEDADWSSINSCAVGGDLVVSKWTGATWEDHTNLGGVTGTCAGATAGTVTSNSVGSFSPFTFGSKSILVNPLPIELLLFNAQKSVNVVDIYWSTSSEINNDYFTVERSSDAVIFSDLFNVKGAGNSNQVLYYNAVDANPLQGISYYRLKQTDFDGKFTYSNIVAVKQNIEDTYRINFTVFPNPSDGKFINLKSNINYLPKTEISIVVVDIFGRKLYSNVLLTDEDGAYFKVFNIYNNIPAGVYFVIGSSDNKMYRQILIIEQ
jgi:hypothetical protein